MWLIFSLAILQPRLVLRAMTCDTRQANLSVWIHPKIAAFHEFDEASVRFGTPTPVIRARACVFPPKEASRPGRRTRNCIDQRAARGIGTRALALYCAEI